MDITELAPLDPANGCDCIGCLGAPWSGTVCKAVVGKARREATAENERMLAETGRNFE